MDILLLFVLVVVFGLGMFFLFVQRFTDKLSIYKSTVNFEGVDLGIVMINLGVSNVSFPFHVKVSAEQLYINSNLFGAELFKPIVIPLREIRLIQDKSGFVRSNEFSVGYPVKVRFYLSDVDSSELKAFL